MWRSHNLAIAVAFIGWTHDSLILALHTVCQVCCLRLDDMQQAAKGPTSRIGASSVGLGCLAGRPCTSAGSVAARQLRASCKCRHRQAAACTGAACRAGELQRSRMHLGVAVVCGLLCPSICPGLGPLLALADQPAAGAFWLLIRVHPGHPPLEERAAHAVCGRHRAAHCVMAGRIWLVHWACRPAANPARRAPQAVAQLCTGGGAAGRTERARDQASNNAAGELCQRVDPHLRGQPQLSRSAPGPAAGSTQAGGCMPRSSNLHMHGHAEPACSMSRSSTAQREAGAQWKTAAGPKALPAATGVSGRQGGAADRCPAPSRPTGLG